MSKVNQAFCGVFGVVFVGGGFGLFVFLNKMTRHQETMREPEQLELLAPGSQLDYFNRFETQNSVFKMHKAPGEPLWRSQMAGAGGTSGDRPVRLEQVPLEQPAHGHIQGLNYLF